MKIVSLLSVLVVVVCLVGCLIAELVNCQQDKDILQGQLDQANATIAEKNSEIETLKTENTEMQNTAMESIKTIMTKQAEKDNQLKQKLVEGAQQIQTLKEKVAALETQIAEHVCVVEAAEEIVEKAVDTATDAMATD